MKKLLLSCMMLLGMTGAAFADEITSYGPDEIKTSIAVGDIFAIYNATEEKFLFGSGAQNLGYDVNTKAFLASNSGWLFKLQEAEGHYLLHLQAPAGGDYNLWGSTEKSYLNSQPADGGCSFILGLEGRYGQDGANLALWDIEAVTGGFKLKNVGTGLYLNSNAPAKFTEEDAVVWTLCTLKEVKVENPIAKGSYDATDAQELDFANFKAIAEGASWNAENMELKGNCGFQWAGDGLDMNQYRYLVLTAANNLCKGGYKAHIKDKNGKEVAGDDYGKDFMNMWFGEWNNHNCMAIDMEQLRINQMFDIHHITELMIEGGDGFTLANAYITNQKPTNDKSWNGEDNGDFSITGVAVDKFGTICLPFQAAIAGAKVYEITGKGSDFISLSEHNGLLAAGKPYFYQTLASNDGGNAPAAVRFYKATAVTLDDPVENNGLIGTFAAIKAPKGDDIRVLSGNKLYTVDVDDYVTVGANKAYIDLTKISATPSRGTVFLGFGDATGIESVKSVESDGAIYNLNGQRLAQPKKGLNIIGGKVIMVK